MSSRNFVTSESTRPVGDLDSTDNTHFSCVLDDPHDDANCYTVSIIILYYLAVVAWSVHLSNLLFDYIIEYGTIISRIIISSIIIASMIPMFADFYSLVSFNKRTCKIVVFLYRLTSILELFVVMFSFIVVFVSGCPWYEYACILLLFSYAVVMMDRSMHVQVLADNWGYVVPSQVPKNSE
ncbi:unnamed protein product [Ectocarpus sp. 6 AP-2014]